MDYVCGLSGAGLAHVLTMACSRASVDLLAKNETLGHHSERLGHVACASLDAPSLLVMPVDEEASFSPSPTLERAAEALFSARTILVFGEINTRVAREVATQLLALTAASSAPVRMIVHSQGGHVEAADSIHDLVRGVAPDLVMIGTGWVASAGALIYAAAKRENRYALPNTRFLLHQPLGGVRGAASDIEIEVEQILQMRQRLNRIFASATGQDYEKIVRDTERNFWMSAQEACAYGLVHRIVSSVADLPAHL